jgi:hypothetical protein
MRHEPSSTVCTFRAVKTKNQYTIQVKDGAKWKDSLIGLDEPDVNRQFTTLHAKGCPIEDTKDFKFIKPKKGASKK